MSQCKLTVQWRWCRPPFWCCMMVSEGAVEVYQESCELLYRIGPACSLFAWLWGIANGGGLVGWWQRLCFCSLDTRSNQPGTGSSLSAGRHQQDMGPMLPLHTPVVVRRIGKRFGFRWTVVDVRWTKLRVLDALVVIQVMW